MRIFTEASTYDFKKFPKVSERKKQFKASEGGQKEVCDLVENYARDCAEKAAREATEKAEKAAKEAAEKAAKEAAEKAEKAKMEAAESARKLFESGVSYEVVRGAMTTLEDSMLRDIYQKVKHSMK